VDPAAAHTEFFILKTLVYFVEKAAKLAGIMWFSFLDKAKTQPINFATVRVLRANEIMEVGG